MISEHLDPETRIGFVSSRYIDPGPPPRVDVGLGRLVESLAAHCPNLVLAASRSKGTWGMVYHALSLDSDQIQFLPSMHRTRDGLLKTGQTYRFLRRLDEVSDVMVVQLPFPAPLALTAIRKPTVFHFCLDPLEVAENAPHYGGYRRPLALAAGHGLRQFYRALFRRPQTRVLANGRRLFERYAVGYGEHVVSTTLYRREVASVVRARPSDAPFRILFVGQLRPEKGLDLLIDGFRQVEREVASVHVQVVGISGASAGEWLERVRVRAHQVGRGQIHFVGGIPWGPDLFKAFADADLLVLPSRAEGTPRVLLEARAFGCPVVAARVGGVPESVTHGVDGLLVPPNDSSSLAEAIVRIAKDPELRTRLVEAGYRRANAQTMDRFVETMARELAAARGASS